MNTDMNRFTFPEQEAGGDGVVEGGADSSGYCLTAIVSIWPSLRQAAPLLPREESGSSATWGSFTQPAKGPCGGAAKDTSAASRDRAKWCNINRVEG